MGRLLSWIVLAPVMVVVVVLAAVNRQEMTFNAWPLPFEYAYPVSFFLIAAVAFGFFSGALVGRLWGGETKRMLRKATERADKAEQDARELRKQLEAADEDEAPSQAA